MSGADAIVYTLANDSPVAVPSVLLKSDVAESVPSVSIWLELPALSLWSGSGCIHCDEKFFSPTWAFGSAIMRVAWDETCAGVTSALLDAAEKSALSGIDAQRRYERRFAIE